MHHIADHPLACAKKAFTNHTSTQSFSAFPNDVKPQAQAPFHIQASDLLRGQTGLFTEQFSELRDAIVDMAPYATWRETYKGTDIGQDFLDRFGCYSIIGQGGPFYSEHLWMWIVYMPAGLHYPCHHHPGEEMYFVIAGEATFHRRGEDSETLRSGETVFHGSNQPHAMTTADHPVLCLVAWRNGFDTAPVLTT